MADTSIQLIQGDCLEVMPTLASGSIDLVLCDLPYGTTRNKWDTIIPLEPLWTEYKRLCKGAIVLTAAQPFTSVLVCSNLRAFKYSWVWKKAQGTGFLNAKKQPLRNTEDVLVFWHGKQTLYNPQMSYGHKGYVTGKGKKTSNYGSFHDVRNVNEDGSRYPTTVIEFTSRKEKDGHPTQKPVALMEYLIRTYTQPGDTVLDNCMGSGTCGVACVNTGRSFIGIERDSEYFAVAQRRVHEPLAD